MPSMYYVSQQLPLGIRASSPSGLTSSQSVRMPSSGRAEAVNVSILLDAADVVDRWARISSPYDRNTENQRVDERSLCKNIMSSVSKKENLSKSPFAEDFVLSSLGNVATSNSTRKKETQSGIVRKTKVGWSKKVSYSSDVFTSSRVDVASFLFCTILFILLGLFFFFTF